MGEEKALWIRFRTRYLRKLIIYYGVLFIIFLSGCIYFTLKMTSHIEGWRMVLQTVSFSSLACSIYYLRKLYKCLIRQEVIFVCDTKTMSGPEIGTLIYFIFRPLLGIPFGMITYFIMEVFMRGAIINTQNHEKYMCLLSIVAFLSGSAIGKYVDAVSRIGNKVVERVSSKASEQVLNIGVECHENEGEGKTR